MSRHAGFWSRHAAILGPTHAAFSSLNRKRRKQKMEIEIEDEALAWLIEKYEEKTNKKLDFNEIVRQYILSRFQGSPQAKTADNSESRP